MTRRIAGPLALALLVAGSAVAQTPPVKPPVPPAPVAGQPAPAAPAAPAVAQPPKGPAQPLPQGTVGILPGKLNPTQKEVLLAISKYFSSIHTLTGEFVQFAQSGSRAEGTFYLSKPGKILFKYQIPSTLEVVADSRDVVVRDRKNQTQDLYPLAKTPLKYLLADQIDLSTEPSVTKVSVDPDLVTVILEQNTIFGDGKIALVFDRKTSDLLQWTVTDAQGYTTDVTIYNTTANQPVDDKLFFIDPLFNQFKTNSK